MDSDDTEAMHLNQNGCDEWNSSYYVSSTSTKTSEVETNRHFECGPSKEQIQNFNEQNSKSTFTKPQIKSKEPINR